MKFSQILILTLAFLSVGCATVVDHHQFVRIVPEPEDAKIFYKGEIRGEGPSTVYLERESGPLIKFEKGKKQKKFRLDTSYRWGQSFAGNALLGIYGLGGVLIDYATGASWEIQDYVKKKKRIEVTKSSRILILPPTDLSAFESRKMGAKLEKWVKKKYPQAWVIPFEETYYLSVGEGFDEESKKSKDKDIYNELLHQSRATHVVYSKYIKKNKTLEYAVYSPFGELEVGFYQKKVELESESTWDWISDQTFELLPNTFSFGFVLNRYTGCAINGLEERYCASSAKQSAFSFLSGVSLTNVLHYRKRELWGLYFRFIPEFGVSYNEATFLKADRTQADLFFEWAFLSFGYGPRLSFVLPVGELFFDLIPVYGVNYTKLYTNNFSETEWLGKFGGTVQLGLHSWISNHWNMRFFLRTYSFTLLQNKNIDAIEPGTRFQDDGIGSVQAGITVGYYFHEEKTRLLDWLFN